MPKKTGATASAEQTGFSLENHSPIKSQHMLALGMDKPIKTTELHHKHGVEYFAEIPRKYLGVDLTYQRKINSSRVAQIKRKWKQQAYKPASVVETFFEGKYYYSITDGQHRCAAYPYKKDTTDPTFKAEEETVFIQLVKDISPVRSFVYSNDKKTTKPLSHDENFWAIKRGLDMGETGGPFDEFKFVDEAFEIMRSHGWTPMRYSSDSQDAGTHASTIHKYWSQYGISRIERKYKKELNDEDPDVSENAYRAFKFECIKLLRDTFTLTNVLLNKNEFSKDNFGGEFWAGMIDFLCNPDCMDMNYDIGLLKRCFKHRSWKQKLTKNDRVRPLRSLESLEVGRASFVNQTYLNKFGQERSLNRVHLQCRQLVYHVYHTGMNLEGKTAAIKPAFKLAN